MAKQASSNVKNSLLLPIMKKPHALSKPGKYYLTNLPFSFLTACYSSGFTEKVFCSINFLFVFPVYVLTMHGYIALRGQKTTSIFRKNSTTKAARTCSPI